MGMWTNQFKGFCPICKEETDQQSFNDNDDTGTHTNCCDCENELPLPKVSIGEPFMIDDDVYFIHQGSDDEWSLMNYHEK